MIVRLYRFKTGESDMARLASKRGELGNDYDAATRILPDAVHPAVSTTPPIDMTHPIDRFSIPFPIRCIALGFAMLSVTCGPSRGQTTASADVEPADQTETGFVKLFDGKTLDGWNGDDHWFRVQDAMIVAGSLNEPIPHNQFLCTDQTYGDFELRLEIKLVGQGRNAGVQFRSRRIDDSTEVSGYQADAGRAWNKPVWGGLYDESRRRKMLVLPPPELTTPIVDPDGFNAMTIRAIGNDITIAIGDVVTARYTERDPNIDPRGIIGLQIHSGPPSEAHYRNIRIKTLGAAVN